MIRLDDRVWILWAVFILLLPVKWLLSAAAAACIHECCHIAALWLLGGKIRDISLDPFGAVIETEGISDWKEILCAIVGPLGSISGVLFIRRFPVFALCALVQGVFNLLPVYPMDGGRALRGILHRVCPKQAECICKWVQIVTYGSLLFAGIWISAGYFGKFWPFLLCLVVILRLTLRKKP